jgi:hypothetical protein
VFAGERRTVREFTSVLQRLCDLGMAVPIPAEAAVAAAETALRYAQEVSRLCPASHPLRNWGLGRANRSGCGNSL